MINLKDSVGDLLKEPFPNTSAEVKTSLERCMNLTEPLLVARCEAQAKLATEKDRLRYPKDKDYTDFDRTIMLNSAIADFEQDYQILFGLECLLNVRISVLSQLL